MDRWALTVDITLSSFTKWNRSDMKKIENTRNGTAPMFLAIISSSLAQTRTCLSGLQLDVKFFKLNELRLRFLGARHQPATRSTIFATQRKNVSEHHSSPSQSKQSTIWDTGKEAGQGVPLKAPSTQINPQPTARLAAHQWYIVSLLLANLPYFWLRSSSPPSSQEPIRYLLLPLPFLFPLPKNPPPAVQFGSLNENDSRLQRHAVY